jgi:hypothetical protein
MITLTPEAMLLLSLLIQNTITALINQVGSMTPEEVTSAIPIEQARNAKLMAEIASH